MNIDTAAYIIKALLKEFPKLAASWAEYSAIKDATPDDWDKVWAINRGKAYDEIVHGIKRQTPP